MSAAKRNRKPSEAPRATCAECVYYEGGDCRVNPPAGTSVRQWPFVQGDKWCGFIETDVSKIVRSKRKPEPEPQDETPPEPEARPESKEPPVLSTRDLL